MRNLWLILLALGVLTTGSSKAQEVGGPPLCIVYGAVQNPGRFEIRRAVRLSEIISLVGGVSEASSGKIQIIHTEGTRSKESADNSDTYNLNQIDLSSDPIIKPGDIIIVPELDPVYVAGHVVNPGSIYLKTPLTLTQALHQAGGITKYANRKRIVIHRVKEQSVATYPLPFNLDDILKHRVEDPTLKAYDVIDVTSNKKWKGPICILPIGMPKELLPVRIIE